MINPVVADFLRIHALYSRYFFLNPSVFIIRAKKTAWPKMLPVYYNYPTLTFLPICLLFTPSRRVRGRSPFLRRNCFPA